MELWVGCIAGALEETEYAGKLAMAGFEKIHIEPREFMASRTRGNSWQVRALT
jgi:hypothetical protein